MQGGPKKKCGEVLTYKTPLPVFHTFLEHVHHTCIQAIGNELSVEGKKSQERLNRLATKGRDIQCVGADTSVSSIHIIDPMVQFLAEHSHDCLVGWPRFS